MSHRSFLLFLLLSSSAFAFESVQLKKVIPPPANSKGTLFTQIAIDASRQIWVTDPANDRLIQYGAQGDFLQSVGHHGTGPGEFASPHGIGASTDGLLYVADSDNARIQ